MVSAGGKGDAGSPAGSGAGGGAAAVPGALAWVGLLLALGAAAVLTSAGIGSYHTGVERGWFDGPDTCTSNPVGGLTPDELFDQIMAAPLIRCDEVAWQFLSLSMASWNMLISLALAALWIVAARQP